MTMRMNTTVNKFKVIDRVIKFVSVNMMDKFFGREFSTKFNFHNSSMFQNNLVAFSSSSISLSSDCAFPMCSFFSKMGISISIPSEIVTLAHSTFIGISLTIKAFFRRESKRSFAFLRTKLGSFNNPGWFNKKLVSTFFTDYLYHGKQYIMDTILMSRGNKENRVNCWKILTDNAEGNQQPSPVNGKKVAGKVQRLMGEESTNNPNTSARPERDDIVWTYGKPQEVEFKRFYDNKTYLKDTLLVPAYEKGNFIGLGSTKLLRGIKNDPDFQIWRQWLRPGDVLFNSEVGMIEQIRWIEINNTSALSNAKGVGDVLGEGLVFGDDGVALAEVETPELRAAIPGNFGRYQAVAWYGVLAYGLIWSATATAGEARVVYITGAAA